MIENLNPVLLERITQAAYPDASAEVRERLKRDVAKVISVCQEMQMMTEAAIVAVDDDEPSHSGPDVVEVQTEIGTDGGRRFFEASTPNGVRMRLDFPQDLAEPSPVVALAETFPSLLATTIRKHLSEPRGGFSLN